MVPPQVPPARLPPPKEPSKPPAELGNDIMSSWNVGRPFPGGGMNALKRWTKNREVMADRLKRQLRVLVAKRKVHEQRVKVQREREAREREEHRLAKEEWLRRKAAFTRCAVWVWVLSVVRTLRWVVC